MNKKTKDLEKTALGIAVMFGLFWIYSIFARPHLSFQEIVKGVLGIALLYVVGLGLFIFITKNVSKEPYARKEKSGVSVKTLILCFLLQCSAFMILNVLAIATSIFGGTSPSSEITPMTKSMLFMLLIFNPVVEEYVFRHLFASRLLKYGERFYILASAWCFAVVHGVSVGFAHIVYTFILGLIWAYLTVKSGNIVLAIIMHAVSNLFNAVIIQLLGASISIEVMAVYSFLIIALGVIGLILFFINRKKIVLDGTSGLLDSGAVKDLFTNKGILLYTAFTLIVIVLKNIIK
jgi:membrane protease YdiL (CAAX protease family)